MGNQRINKKPGPKGPHKWTREYKNEVIALMGKYIKENEIPILAEFCYLNSISRQELYKHPELRDSMEKLLLKKEAQLESKGLQNEINPTIAKFSLYQLGWTEQQKIEHTGGVKIIRDDI